MMPTKSPQAIKYQPVVNYYNQTAGLEKQYHALGKNSRNGHELYVGIVSNDSGAYPTALVEMLARDEAKGKLVSASVYEWLKVKDASTLEYGRYTTGEHREWQVDDEIFAEMRAWVAARMAEI